MDRWKTARTMVHEAGGRYRVKLYPQKLIIALCLHILPSSKRHNHHQQQQQQQQPFENEINRNDTYLVTELVYDYYVHGFSFVV